MGNSLPVKAIISHNIKKYRKLNNMTQAHLAELADVSNTYIANIECSQTWLSDKTLEKIAAALHVEAYMLFIPEDGGGKAQATPVEWQETISYLARRQEELCRYIQGFFSETFMHISQGIPRPADLQASGSRD